MSDVDRRAVVAAMYPKSPRWQARVANMSEGQIFAIWKKENERQHAEAKKKSQPKTDDIPF